jgi:hypothetical protein
LTSERSDRDACKAAITVSFPTPEGPTMAIIRPCMA